MSPNFAKYIIVVIIRGHIFGSIVVSVEESLRSNVLRAYGTYPADGVVFRVRYARSRWNMMKGWSDVRAIQLGASEY